MTGLRSTKRTLIFVGYVPGSRFVFFKALLRRQLTRTHLPLDVDIQSGFVVSALQAAFHHIEAHATIAGGPVAEMLYQSIDFLYDAGQFLFLFIQLVLQVLKLIHH